MKYKKLLLIISTLIICNLLVSCNKAKPNMQELNIAQQFGYGYAPVQIVKELNLLRTQDVKVNYTQLANTAAIREAMLAGEVDVGFMAIPPFLIGLDKGMEWKIISGVSQAPLGLITNDSNINSLEDFNQEDKIALPQPGSIQHILLSMACLERFNDPNKLDNNLISMSHPDGLNAMISGNEIKAHFTSPPYLYKELEIESMKQILSGKEAFGSDFTFIVAVASKDCYNNKSDLLKKYILSLHKGIELIEDKPMDAANTLENYFGIKSQQIYSYITWEGSKYTSSVKGIEKFAEFMESSEYIRDKEIVKNAYWNEENEN